MSIADVGLSGMASPAGIENLLSAYVLDAA